MTNKQLADELAVEALENRELNRNEFEAELAAELTAENDNES